MKKLRHLGFIIFWTLLDCGIKAFIKLNYANSLDQCSGGIVHFHPTYNKAGNFMNDRFGVGFSQTGFEIMLFVFLVATIWLWFDLEKDLKKRKYSNRWLYFYDFIIAGCIARVIERVGGRYTLDYIAVRYIGILDTVDIYFLISILSMIALAIIQCKDKCVGLFFYKH